MNEAYKECNNYEKFMKIGDRIRVKEHVNPIQSIGFIVDFTEEGNVIVELTSCNIYDSVQIFDPNDIYII